MTTIQHFRLMIPVLRRLRRRFGETVYFKVIGDRGYRSDELGIQGIDWNPRTEIEDLSELDVGLMPLPDDRMGARKVRAQGSSVHGARDTHRDVARRRQHGDHRRRPQRIPRAIGRRMVREAESAGRVPAV